MSTGEGKCVRDRYIRSAAIVIATTEGIRNIYVAERRKKPVASVESNKHWQGRTLSNTSDISIPIPKTDARGHHKHPLGEDNRSTEA